MASILFICTGNIFRSLVAEYALKALLEPSSPYMVGSAGIEALPQPVHPLIREYILAKGGSDPVGHVQRKLTRELLDQMTLLVAMGLDHRDFIRETFHRDVLLFNEVCFQKCAPILDLHEAIPDWQRNLEASRNYVISVIDHIWDAMPAFLAALEEQQSEERRRRR